MATIRSVLMRDRPDPQGRCPIYIKVSNKGERLHFATGFDATEKEFRDGKDEGRFVQGKGIPKFYVFRKENGCSTQYDNKEANSILIGLEEKIKKLIDGYNEAGIPWKMSQLKDDLLNKPRRSLFYAFAQDAIESEYISREAYQRAEIVQQALASFSKYDPDFETRSILDITPKYIQGYINYWTKNGHSDATIALRLREIRRLYNIAIRDGLVERDSYPFSSGSEDNKIKIRKAEIKKADQYLTTESLNALTNAKDLSKILDKTRHIFLFSFHCRGINWKDMALLTSESLIDALVTDETTKKTKQVKLLQYTRSKTKGDFNIQVSPEIQRELDWFKANTKLYGDHLVPIILEKVDDVALNRYLKQSRRRYNRYLKDLAKEVGLPESQQDISIYTARHSFAMAMQTNNKSVEIISQALGHQSVETTKHYLAKFSTTKMADETSGLLDTKEDKKAEPEQQETQSNAKAERILELSKLVAEGLLTKEEFISLKAEIISSSKDQEI